MTTAQKVSAIFRDDGTNFQSDDGNLDDVCCQYGGHCGVADRCGDMWRYEFADESAITGNAAGWDIEGEEPFSMSGA